MSKKDIVKEAIDKLIEQGHDFHEITQGTLSKLKELEGISKTTLKRAKNEYKKEKIVVKSNYKETLIKRKIYKYLDRNPKTTLSELREALPDLPPKKVSEYHLFWTRKKEKAKTAKVQEKVHVNPRKLKELVFNYLNKHEEITCDQLLVAFPDANRSSVTSYYGHWKKKRASHEKGKEGSLYNVIFRYLDNNDNVSIDMLKKTFKDVPIRSLEVYHNLWLKKEKESQIAPTTTPAAINKVNPERKTKKKISKSTSLAKSIPAKSTRLKTQKDNSSVFKSKAKKNIGLKNKSIEPKIISKLLETIESQKLTLTALEVEYSMLKNKKGSRILPELDSMTDKELKDIKEFIKTYVKGLNKKVV